MYYENLQALIQKSSSTRQYFLSLPVDLQLSLHEQNNCIHTARELREYAAVIENYHYHVKLGKWN